MKDAVALDMEPDGMVIVNGPQGITGTPKRFHFSDWDNTDPDHSGYHSEYGEFKRRPRNHGDP